jgi:hypothetical protein
MKKIIYGILPLCLTGCVGSLITGQTEYADECYPDIRTVPSRAEAVCARSSHPTEEKAERARDFKQLSQDWEEINARDQALRERLFPEESEE